MRRESEAAGRLVFTGLKKIFTPVVEKLKSIITAPEFGPVSSISVRYPQAIPAFEDRGDLNAMRGFLDHIYHPAAILGYLMGPIERFSSGHTREPPGRGDDLGTAGDTVSIPAGAVHNARNLGEEQAVFLITFSSANREVVGE